LAVDDAKLRQALEADFEAVADLFSGVGATSTDGRVAYASSTASTVPGSYLVNVTTAAGRASVIGTVYLPPAVPETFQITSGAGVATVTLDPGDDLAAAVAKITAALAATSITTVSVSEADGAVALAESRTGAAAAFTVSANSLGLAGTHAGTDVAGTIGGQAATGAGSVLTATAGGPKGLSLTVTATAAEVAGAGGALSVGTVTFGRGLLGRVASFLEAAVDTDGTVSRARARWQSQVDLLDDRIEALEERLERREVALNRQFTALETAISRMSSLSAALAAQLSSLSQES
jgi:flagellar hook-associated protein 2